MALLAIGRFAQVTQLTVKALRLYDELGLLRPAHVDLSSGYRYYRLDQAAAAEQIRLLRLLEMPLEDIGAVLRLTRSDPAAARALIERHRGRLVARIAGFRRALELLDRLLEGDTQMPYQVHIKELPAQEAIVIRTRTGLAQVGEAMGSAFGELGAYAGRHRVRLAGPPFSVYPDPEMNEDDFAVEIGLPVASDGRSLPAEGRVTPVRLEASRAASTVHLGAYDQIHVAHQALLGWLQEHGHQPGGPSREVYLAGPPAVTDPLQFRTEAVLPIR